MGAQWKHRIRQASGAAKGRVFSKLAKEIVVAAKAGGADPAMNAKLRALVESAKKASMPRDTLERAIKKGSGVLDENVHYETIVYEGFGPHRVPVIVECLTDNAKRTAQNIRHLFRNGHLGNSGSVSWDFIHGGQIEATHGGGADAEEAAIEAGAQEVESADGDGGEPGFRFYTEPADLDAVTKALGARGWTVAGMRLGWRAKNPVPLDDAQRTEVERFLADLDEDDDVQQIYAGLT
jgi:YebC/PmpR family DNA-binding regulatory protein